MNITFIGAGYVGLVSATMLSHLGHNVMCCDNNKDKILGLQRGEVPIYEPELDRYIEDCVAAGRLQFSSSSPRADDVTVVFIAVGTPPLESGSADLSYVEDTVMQVAKSSSPNTLIVIKSTVPPGTCLKLQAMLRNHNLGHEVVSNPEFLREGSAIEDFLNPDRIVLGTSSKRAEELLMKVYATFASYKSILLCTDPTTSELIKYASNSFLATKIGFINEMANLCERVGADIDTLSKGMGMDKRIGSAFLKAGPGFGGSCFPKDLLALSHLASQYNQPCHILDSVIFSNKDRPAHMVGKISNVMGDLRSKTICALGITFKAETDDVRSSPAVDIISLLIERGATVRVYDPAGAKNGALLAPNADFCRDAYEAASEADAIVILTEWNEFKDLDFKKLMSIMAGRDLFDFRNILNGKSIGEIGFHYHKVGK